LLAAPIAQRHMAHELSKNSVFLGRSGR